jgi:hypothetical protein
LIKLEKLVYKKTTDFKKWINILLFYIIDWMV